MKMTVLSLMLMSFCAYAGACSPVGNAVKTEEPAPEQETAEGTEQEPEEDREQPGGGRTLTVYFSCTNTTKGVADKIASITGGETFRIEPEEPYTPEDLNYNNSSSRANQEQNDPSARPAIANAPEGLENYDVVFLGYPIWWGEAPKIIYTFLESYDFSGKTIVPFCTSGSSPIGSSDDNLHPLAPQAEWKDGRRFGGSESESIIREWIDGLCLTFGTGN